MEIQRYAIVSEVLPSWVYNVCLWDGNTETWQPEPGYVALLCPPHVDTSYIYDGENWIYVG